MFKVNLYDKKNGIFKLMEFKSLSLALSKAKEQEKFHIKVYDGKRCLQCAYNKTQGWIIESETTLS